MKPRFGGGFDSYSGGPAENAVGEKRLVTVTKTLQEARECAADIEREFETLDPATWCQRYDIPESFVRWSPSALVAERTTPHAVVGPPEHVGVGIVHPVIIVTGSVQARPETIDEVQALSLAHVLRSRQEPGCLLHSVLREVEDRLRLVFLEHWVDESALRAHFEVTASRQFVGHLSALAARPPEMSIYRAESVAL
jgi:quinol monooxygenase YgiN